MTSFSTSNFSNVSKPRHSIGRSGSVSHRVDFGKGGVRSATAFGIWNRSPTTTRNELAELMSRLHSSYQHKQSLLKCGIFVTAEKAVGGNGNFWLEIQLNERMSSSNTRGLVCILRGKQRDGGVSGACFYLAHFNFLFPLLTWTKLQRSLKEKNTTLDVIKLIRNL